MTRPEMTIPPELAPFQRPVTAGGLRLHCYDSGPASGVPLVLIHGLGDEADTWRQVFGPLAARRRVIALDLPGFGRSAQPRRAYTTGFFAQVVADMLAALDIPQAMVVGHSMGAAVALRLALARPQLVARLALLAGGLPIQPRAVPSTALLPLLLPLLGERVYTGLRRSQDEAEATLRPFYQHYDSLSAEQRAFLRERVWARVWSDGQRRAFLSALRWMAIDGATRAASFRARLAQLATPTQLIWGEADLIAPIALGEALAGALPHAQLQRLPDCGHQIQQERPAELVALLEEHRL